MRIDDRVPERRLTDQTGASPPATPRAGRPALELFAWQLAVASP